MAYKPYKPNRGLDAKHQKKFQKNESNIKLFGFRSGLSYRMLPAIMYYMLVTTIYVVSIVNEIKYFQFSGADVFLMVSKYLFIGIALYSPAIFLSDFKYVDSLPFFKQKKVSSSLIGLILVIAFCYFMWSIDIYCMSKTYQQSVKAYQTQVQKEMEQMTLETETESKTKSEEMISKEAQ